MRKHSIKQLVSQCTDCQTYSIRKSWFGFNDLGSTTVNGIQRNSDPQVKVAYTQNVNQQYQNAQNTLDGLVSQRESLAIIDPGSPELISLDEQIKFQQQIVDFLGKYN